MKFGKIGKKEFHNIREWIGMALWISAAIMLAYGVIRVPGKFMSFARHYISGKHEERIERTAFAIYLDPGTSGKLDIKYILKELPRYFDKTSENIRLVVYAVPSQADRIDGVIKAMLADKNPAVVLLVADSDSDSFMLEMQAMKTGNGAAGPERFLSRLPVHDMQRRLASSGFKAAINYAPKSPTASDSNAEAFYRLMNFVTVEKPGIKAGFIQIPGMEKSGQKSLEEWTDWAAKGLSILVKTALE
jgi:pyrrolidone-carboxylate peptidase